ncbi:unnamed protein product [Ilex paraguariensis]|uniref:Protein SPT2 homolog n=1 Tax=Ilex paraguariensis TaxID=185542 RepID=A0ABC8SEK8_9AQUA
MQRYDRDEYEDLDEYEEESEEQEEEACEEEEAPQPTQEELEYLELRKRLKESIRKQMKKESGSTLANSQEKKNRLPYNNYGSFFGPSQAVISQRVIQESKSLLENPHLAAKVSKTNNHGNNKGSSSTPARSKPQTNGHPRKVTNGLKTKAQMLKNTRDYSFLLSDDAELPAPAKDPLPRSVSVPKSDARPIQEVPKNKQSLSNTGRKVLNGREGRKPVPIGCQMQSKMGTPKLASTSKLNQTSADTRKQLGSNNGSGPGRSSGQKEVPFGIPRGSNKGSGPGRPLGPKGLSSKISGATTEKKVSMPNAKSCMPSVYKPAPSKLQPSISNQPLVHKKVFQESKIRPKQPAAASKPQVKQPPAKISARASLQGERPKKKPIRQYPDDDDDDDDGGKAISMIRSMFGYNPNKYRDDDDDSDMEAGFDDILREEKRSAMIAKREDEEELLKTEEEERREQLRREAKKRKLSHR